MKKILATVLISSLLLTQCYTQNQYLTKEYTFNEEDDLEKIVLTDSTVREFGRNEYSYKIESDSLLITSIKKGEKHGDHTRMYSLVDTLTLSEIQSVFVSEYDCKKTFNTCLMIGGAIGIIYLVVLILEGPDLDFGFGEK